MENQPKQPQHYEFPDPYVASPRSVIDKPDSLDDWAWATGYPVPEAEPPQHLQVPDGFVPAHLQKLLEKTNEKYPQHPSDTDIL